MRASNVQKYTFVSANSVQAHMPFRQLAVRVGVAAVALYEAGPRIPVGISFPDRRRVYMALRSKKRVYGLDKALMGCAEGSPPLLWPVLGLEPLHKAPTCVPALHCAV